MRYRIKDDFSKRAFASWKFIIMGMVFSILVVSFFTYLDIFTYFFTATDTLTLIDTNRIQSPEKIIEIFTSPLMAGTSFTTGGLFYRPVSSLTYSLDYFLWGLNPVGYHVTDLALHMLTCVFIFYVFLLVTNLRKLVAWMGTIVFAIHPILVENVPAIARRQDTLAALFLLIALLFFLFVQNQHRHSGLFGTLSLVAYSLALGSKETAIILPVLLFVYLFISSLATNNGDNTSISYNVVQALRKTLPYISVAFIYIVWRGYVLNGLGGYTNQNFGLLGTVWFSIGTIGKFISSLMFPVAIPVFTAQLLMGIIGLCLLMILAKFYYLKGKTLIIPWFSGGLTSIGAFRRFCAVILSVSVFGIFSYPFYIHSLRELIERSYSGTGVLTSFMRGRDFTPLSYYLDLFQNLIIVGLFTLLVLSLTGLVFAGVTRQSMVRLLATSEIIRIVIFFVAWTLLPLSILLATRTFQFWNMYIPAIPFSALVSIVLIEPIQYIKNNYIRGGNFSILSYVAVWSLFTAVCMVIYLFFFSPLLHKYAEWKDSGKLSSILLDEISRISAELPPDTTIHIYGLPSGIASYATETPRIKSVTYLEDYSIKSWLDLTRPGNGIQVVVDKYSILEAYTEKFNFNVQLQQDGAVLIFIEPEF